MRFAVLTMAALLLGAAAPVLPPGQATPAAHPYDEAADAHAAVAAAFAQARQTGRKVLLDFGGNWCPDCRMLSGVLDQPQVRPWLAENFVVVAIDVGRYTKNTDIAARWGVKLHAAPSVLVVTPDGRLINGDDVTGLADARSFSSQAVVDLLAKMARS
jgi:thiol-disulfide isomerase/thioredoxin